MAKGAGATMNIDLVMRKIEIAHGSHGDNRKGLVDLKKINITQVPADLFRKLAYRADWGSWIKVRLVGMGGMADQNGARGEPALFRLRAAHEEECSCGIRDRGGIGGRHSDTVAKGRAKGRNLVQGRPA